MFIPSPVSKGSTLVSRSKGFNCFKQDLKPVRSGNAVGCVIFTPFDLVWWPHGLILWPLRHVFVALVALFCGPCGLVLVALVAFFGGPCGLVLGPL